MEILSSLFEIVINLLESVIGAQFYIRYLGYRDEKHKGIATGIIIGSHFVTVCLCNYLTYMSGNAEWLFIVVRFIVIIIVLKGRIFEKVFLVGIHSIFLCTISVLLFSLFDKWITYDSNGYMEFGVVRIILVIIAKTMEFVSLETILHFRIKETEFVDNKVYMGLSSIIAATMVSQLYIRDIIYKEAYADNLANEAKFVAVSLVVIDLLVYILCMNMTRNNIELLKERMKNAAYESRMKDIEYARNLHQKTMKIRHDMKNELLNIRIKIESGRVKESIDYIEDVLNVKLAKNNVIFTDNMLVDAVINACVEKCSELGIVLEMAIECPVDNSEEMDMAVMLSNLLDNAVEAAKQTEERYINLKISRTKKYLHIYIKNSCTGEVLKGEKGLKTTKKDTFFHGYGLLNVNDIVKKYNGEYEGTLNGKVYETNIALYFPDTPVQDRN